MSKNMFHKDQYIVCRNNKGGSGGGTNDIVVGQIKSVNRNGKVIVQNLLSDVSQVRELRTLIDRNIAVSKSDAQHVLGAFRSRGLSFAREIAAHVASVRVKELAGERTAASKRTVSVGTFPIRTLPVKQTLTSDKLDDVLDRYESLSKDEKQAFARKIFKQTLAAFGL